ncbi:MAG: hypothetical protein CM1200mP36_00490 [Gammaproteobacteria bacterium]|nr:MAG: hypothetical protein CM1200mP36_00490 [Gammaproteobacteria bacterium]
MRSHVLRYFVAWTLMVGFDLRWQPDTAWANMLPLVAAGALSFEDALRLVTRRAELMSEFGKGSMLATTLDLSAAKALADKHFCGIGGCNLSQQTVIAGQDADLDRLTEDLTGTTHVRELCD